jgi:perosamine synthetase
MDRSDILLNPESEDCRNSYWMSTIVFPANSGIHQKQLLDAFSAENIDAREFFWPLSALRMEF